MRGSLIIVGILNLALTTSIMAAEEPSWRKGRLYYSNVCTQCHKQVTGHPVSPSSRTKAQWQEYLDNDIHVAGKDDTAASWFWSNKYREEIQSENPVAAAFLEVSEADLLNHIKAYLLYGAKDSDTPLSCN